MKFAAFCLAIAMCVHTGLAAAAQFKHVVVIFQENRTPDNLFQGLCTPPFGSPASCSVAPRKRQYDIQTANWLNKDSQTGLTQPLPVPLAIPWDIDHSHAAFVAMCDAASSGRCRMDGAAREACGPDCPADAEFRYVDNSSGILNPYLELATQYGWANYMFQTNQGPSFPAHQFIFGGTSAPNATDDKAGIFAAENVSGGNGTAGCIAPDGATVALIGPTGDEIGSIYPCFEHRTIPDLLHDGFTWRYYTPSAGSIWTAPNAIQHICESSGPGGECTGQQWADNVDLHPSDVLLDIADCKLSSLSWVIPNGFNSDHANANDGGGPSWVASIVNAIGSSTACDDGRGYWKDTAIFVTWDDWGGWYDHEPPQFLPAPQGGYQRGFRVPLIVVSAYTRAGYIDNQRADFGSILRFIEQNFSIREGALHFADARARDSLLEFFDLSRKPRRYTTIAAPKSARFFINDTRPATAPDDD